MLGGRKGHESLTTVSRCQNATAGKILFPAALAILRAGVPQD